MTIEHPDIPAARTAGYLFKGQAFHLVAILGLFAVAYAFAAPVFTGGTWLGLTVEAWFWLNAALVVVHQVVVWLVFRGQLGWQVMTKIFGRADMAVWGLIFMPMLLLRPVAVLGVALADTSTLALPAWTTLVLGLALCVPAVFAMYSVARYFDIPRALGGDHFREHYRRMPLVTGGAFATPATRCTATSSSGCGPSHCWPARKQHSPPRSSSTPTSGCTTSQPKNPTWSCCTATASTARWGHRL